MRNALLICTGIVTLALMADAQIPTNHRKAPQRTTKYSGYRGTSTVRQAVTKTHVFVRAISSTGIFNRAIPPADFQNDTAASTNEQFVRESARNDQHRCFEKNAPTCN